MSRPGLVIVLLTTVLFGARERGLAQLPPPLSISDSRVFRPKIPTEIKTVEDAMAAVITVTSKDLGLPVVEPLYIHLHKTTKDFAANAGRSGRRLSSETARFSIAIAQENQFHLNMEKVGSQQWSALMWTLAHEYAHNIEYAFSSVGRGPQWIREGFADWVAAKVLDILGWQDYFATTQRAKREVQRQAAALPRLADLEESAKWSLWADGPTGYALTYRLAFLAVDNLMARGGLPAMEKYFTTKDFPTYFGISWNNFEKEFKSSLLQIPSSAASLGPVEKPDWKTSYRWVYQWKSPGGKGTLTRAIDKEDVLDGVPTYIVKSGNSVEIFSRETLGLIATASQEKLLTKRSSPHEFFSWPLAAGKEWKTNFMVENLAQKTSQKFAYVKMIPAVEEVKVPAGVFETLKIETYVATSGRLVTEQWYAPAVKWFAKIRNYLPDGVRQDELTSVKFE